MKLLHIDSSILGEGSTSRQLSAEIVAKYREDHPAVAVTYRDLAAVPVPHLSGPVFAASIGGAVESEGAVRHDIALSDALLTEFQQADVVVIGVGLYNFSVPSQLKAWLDRIVVKGKTFSYDERGPQGLAGGKQVVLAVARGGFYGPQSPMAAWEHAETYLRALFGFLGVTDLEVVIAEGLNVGPEQRAQALAAASKQIAALGA
jgi:FMN-dependent NADH-azoreductase